MSKWLYDTVRLDIGGVVLEVEDDPIFKQLVPEILGPYEFDSIPFHKGDVVLDIGAHQGLVSMYLANRFGVEVYAYEPVPENFERLKRNLRRNGITTVHPHKLAVNADGRYMEMIHGNHSAEGSAWFTPNRQKPFRVRATTIPRIFVDNRIGRCRLLKLDCEGAEHEILADSDSWLDRVDYVRGEIHMIRPLAQAGWSVEGTKARVPPEMVAWQVVEA